MTQRVLNFYWVKVDTTYDKNWRLIMCMIKCFRGEGVVDGESGSSEGCLKWGGGVIKGSFQKHLKTGDW